MMIRRSGYFHFSVHPVTSSSFGLKEYLSFFSYLIELALKQSTAFDRTRNAKDSSVINSLLACNRCGVRQRAVTNRTALKSTLQSKLDERHGAGDFPVMKVITAKQDQ